MTVDEALSRLVVIEDYDAGNGPESCVHSFRGGTGIMLGAHWSVEKVRAAMEQHGVEEAGGVAKGMRHGLVVVDDTGPVFFETRDEGDA